VQYSTSNNHPIIAVCSNIPTILQFGEILSRSNISSFFDNLTIFSQYFRHDLATFLLRKYCLIIESRLLPVLHVLAVSSVANCIDLLVDLGPCVEDATRLVCRSSSVLVEHGEFTDVDRHTAPDFDVVDEDVICGDEQDPVEQEGDVDAVDIMVLLLTGGLPDDTGKEVWCSVDVSYGA
jgi:hypothetical protein